MNINTKKLAFQYSALQGIYWITYCVVYGFATIFLLAKGFSSSQIGIIVALGNIFGVVLQPVFASIADRSKTFTLHRLTAILAVTTAIFLLLLAIVPNMFLAIAAIFLLTDMLIQIIQPLINSFSVYYVNQGVSVNFGFARGIGSLSYAISSSGLGLLVKKYNANILPYVGILFGLILCAVVLSLPVLTALTGNASAEAAPANAEVSDNQTDFFRKYKNFTITLIGLTFLFIFQNMTNSYLIQIFQRVGGDSSDMGNALAIAALVELPVMFLFSLLIRRFKSTTLLMVSAFMFCVKAAAYLMAGSVFQLYLVQFLQMGAFAVFAPASVYYVNEVMDEQDKFKGQAFMTSTNTLGGVFGSLLGGFLIDYTGVSTMLLIDVIIAVIGCLLVWMFVARKDRTDNETVVTASAVETIS
jgi:PPP family 3-phenylpropionic acid transporter